MILFEGFGQYSQFPGVRGFAMGVGELPNCPICIGLAFKGRNFGGRRS